MPAPFLILALPRSRTTWLSRFLSYGDWRCGHDELMHVRQLEDVRSWLAQPNTGTVETAAAPFWRLALHMQPDLKLVVIRRDPDEAVESAMRAGLVLNRGAAQVMFRRMDAKLQQVAKRTGARSIRFEDLAREDVCAELFEHLLPYKHDSARWKLADATNVQIDPLALRRYVAAYSPQLERINGIARQASLSLIQRGRSNDVGGVRLDVEPLANLLRDGEQAMREHCAEVGEGPEGWGGKNLAGLQKLEDVGALQVVTARCNGRVLGYLVTTICESLERPGRLSACHTAFYGPGLGLRLQRFAADALRRLGVHEVIMRAGVRGSAERVASLYRRIGAEPFGEYYRLSLGAA